jgi:proline dehydrogenase
VTDARSRVQRWARPRLLRAAELLARHHVAGETAEAAARVASGHADRGIAATIGYWDRPGDTPAEVAAQYLACLDTLAEGRPGHVSIKLTALEFSAAETDRVLGRAAELGRRVHLDAMDHPSAGPMLGALARMRERHPGADLGHTLPGRWRRSVADAGAVVELGVAARVVKGQWADPGDPDADRRAGFLRVVDALAGRTREVAVASHDVPLAAEACRRLRIAGTPCVLELLHGLPMRASLRQARELGLSVRVYVPYGTAYLPYALGALRREPGKLAWLARDVAGLLADSLTSTARERRGVRAAR